MEKKHRVTIVQPALLGHNSTWSCGIDSPSTSRVLELTSELQSGDKV